MTDQALTAADVAQRIGVAVSTVHAYHSRGILPPATMVGRTPTWSGRQIDEWTVARPGRGAGGGRPIRPTVVTTEARR